MLQYSADGRADRLRLGAVAHTAIATMSVAATMPVTIHGVGEDVADGGYGACAATTFASPISAAAARNAVDDGKAAVAAETPPLPGVPA